MIYNQAIEKLKTLKAIIDRMNSETVTLITAAAEIEIIIRKNDISVEKYLLIEKKIDLLIRNYKNLIN